MVKHNNIIPNIHCHKKFLQSSRGPLKVKLTLNQAARKKARRVKRAARAAKLAPQPLQRLRPVVHCPTQRYSSKQRLGRGFTLEELKEAGVNPKYARTVGIAVDHRRRNRSQESLDRNVFRLKQYLEQLVVLKKGESSDAPQVSGVLQPLVKPSDTSFELMEVTDELKGFEAFTTMRVVRQETRVDGFRVAVENRKKKD